MTYYSSPTEGGAHMSMSGVIFGIFAIVAGPDMTPQDVAPSDAARENLLSDEAVEQAFGDGADEEADHAISRTQTCVGGGTCGDGYHCCGDGTRDWCCPQTSGCGPSYPDDGCR
ncbi:hypothetical protein [Nannocystis punicea]|uniref:Uncharacterized protein n=1 Tax=Nannocystis punicea TaxID=2995304 RepID=A0ABY7GXC0_9BACT|nr:hypothetical protein [Nannocystis poenicansa]WAS91628.1 hypothetical protein O0S08_36060 [Nannocystis poenicansa]